MKSLLIIKPGAIGDVLHMTPVVRAIKKNLPDTKVFFLVGNQVTSEILYHNPYIDEIILYEKGRGAGELSRIIGLSKSLKLKQIDGILNYQPSNWRWRCLTFILKPQGVFLYKRQKRVKGDEKVRHAVEDHLATLSPMGILKEGLHLDFFLTDQEIQEAKAIIANCKGQNGCRGIISLNMGAFHPINRWPVYAFYKLNSLLTSRGYKTVLIGGSQDRLLADQFLNAGPCEALDLVGSLSIRRTAAILRECDILVSGDTGPLHLATSVETRVIGLFGAADPKRTGPIGARNIVIQPDLPCVPCRKRHCPRGKRLCMETIEPETVATQIDHIFV